MRFSHRAILGLVGALLLSASALAQFDVGRISGTVYDPTGAVVPGAILVKVELAGICASDYYAFEGKSINDPTVRGEFPRGVGHEMVGTIAEKGDRVESDARGQSISEGDRIVSLAWIPCGSCYYCRILRKADSV